MSDASSLRTLLTKVNLSSPSIHSAAGAMMKHYDRSASAAVTEWRNALQTASGDQLLPLLYVANEVLQNSKRNRGNNYLEAMSPVLGQSLQYICRRDPSVTEKVRRTVKIWGDRQVYSVKYVAQLLNGLEPFRHGHVEPPSATNPAFSPEHKERGGAAVASKNDKLNTTADAGDDEIRDILESHDSNESVEDENVHDDDDEDIFANDDSQSQKLEIEINLGSALEGASTAAATPTNAKRRRSSMSSGSQGSHTKARKRKSVLSTSNLSEMWSHLSELQQKFDGAEHTLSRIDERHTKVSVAELESMVGDELQQAYRQNEKDQAHMAQERKNLHEIAQERKSIELEAVRYLVWLEGALKQDEEDMQLCYNLEQKILSFKDIHAAIKDAQEKRLAEERKKQKEKEERDRLQKEREEQEKFRQAALARETEAKPGMVWNPTTREYQALNTDETWRE